MTFQVTSSTHPNSQMAQMVQDPSMAQNASLRGLLAHNPPAYRPPTNPLQYQYQQQQQKYQRYPPQPAQVNAPNRQMPPQNYQNSNSLLNRMQQMRPNQPPMTTMHVNVYQNQQQAVQNMQGARWHIPQNSQGNLPQYPGGNNRNMQSAQVPTPPNDTYKIMLKQQNAAAPKTSLTNHMMNNETGTVVPNIGAISHTVSSSMPKTPSPFSQGKNDETEKSLDKFCQKSLSDLMKTIAKLDSNGITVMPEAEKNHLDSSHVDSSTDEAINNMGNNAAGSIIKYDL